MSDITLAVGDGARRMTYAELAESRRISVSSAERLVRRRNWRRQVGNDGVVRILVPLDNAENRRQRAHSDNRQPVRTTPPDIRTADDVRGTIRTLETAVRTLGEQLEVANGSVASEHERGARSERRVDELLAALTEERRRVEMERQVVEDSRKRSRAAGGAH